MTNPRNIITTSDEYQRESLVSSLRTRAKGVMELDLPVERNHGPTISETAESLQSIDPEALSAMAKRFSRLGL